MFGDDELNGRHVDYGSSTKKSRKQLLQETRALRARRKKQKKEHEAATKIQSFVRGRLSEHKWKARLRKQWDANLASLAKRSPKLFFQSEHLQPVVRELLAFYSAAAPGDSKRLQNLCRFLLGSLQLGQRESNYFALAVHPENSVQLMWFTQMKQLLAVLLWNVEHGSVLSSPKISPVLVLLWSSLELAQWGKLLKSLDADAAQRARDTIRSWQLRIWTQLPDGFGALRRCITKLAFLPDPAASTTLSSHKAELRILLAIATRPLVLCSELGLRVTNWSFTSTAEEEEKMNVPMQVDDEPDRAFDKAAAAKLHRSFVTQILGIPLLDARLKSAQLPGIGTLIADRQTWTSLLWLLGREANSLVGTDNGVPSTTGSASSSSSAPSPSSSSSAPHDSAPPSQAHVPSFSWWDELESKSAWSPAAAAAVDEKVPLNTSVVSDDEDEDSGGTSVLSGCGPSSVAAWLWGNLGCVVDSLVGSKGLGSSSSSSSSSGSSSNGDSDMLHEATIMALRALCDVVPQSDLPASGHRLHPHYVEQLALFAQPDVLQWLVSFALNGTHLASGQAVCTVLEALLQSRSSSMDILNMLVFSTPILQALWKTVLDLKVFPVVKQDPSVPLGGVLSLLCSCYSHLLMIQDDDEFHDMAKPFSISDVRMIVDELTKLLYELHWVAPVEKLTGAGRVGALRLRSRCTKLFKQLRDRQSRRRFCPPKSWLMKGLTYESLKQAINLEPNKAWNILTNLPFVLPFRDRVRLLYDLIAADKQEWADGVHGMPLHFNHGQGVQVTIRRSHIIEDGYDTLHTLGPRLKGRVQIQFANEAGIDGGGLFKEFLTTLLKSAFEPQWGLFSETDDHRAYPNPHAEHVPDLRNNRHLDLFYFMGQVMAKALYDHIIIEPQFANFFLRKLLGQKNHVDDLASLDAGLHKHLLFLKRYDGDFEDLALTFSVDETVFGQTRHVLLVRNGDNVPVTKQNVIKYIFRMANYKLNQQIRPHCDAFIRGMKSIVRVEWMQMFAADELSQLLSGQSRIDTNDLREHTHYSGGYSKTHELIRWFWSIVDEMTEEEKANLLKFATSCSRAPLLGFKSLDPKFCIQRTNASPEALPTASTCMNLLRVPRYLSRAQLKAKLLYACSSASGFELT